MSFGETSENQDILSELQVIDAYYSNENLIVVMNDTFQAFDERIENNYTRPGDFIYSLKNLLSQITDAQTLTIDYEGKNNSVIHPDGFVIDKLNLREAK